VSISDDLFLAVSNIIGTRVTEDNFRTKMKEVESMRGITHKDKNQIIIEIILAIAKLDK
jgi:hypothetical protein